MALNSSGKISIGGTVAGESIELELGMSGTAPASLNDAAFRTLAGKASGLISLSDFYGKSSGAAFIGAATETADNTFAYPAGTQSGDVMFMVAMMQGTLATPTGWTLLSSTGITSAPGVNLYLYVKVSGGETSAAMASNFHSSGGIAAMSVYRGVATYSAVSGWTRSPSAAAGSTPSPPVVGSKNVLAFVSGWVGSTTSSSVTSITGATPGTLRAQVPTSVFGLGVAIGDILNTSAGGGLSVTFNFSAVQQDIYSTCGEYTA